MPKPKQPLQTAALEATPPADMTSAMAPGARIGVWHHWRGRLNVLRTLVSSHPTATAATAGAVVFLARFIFVSVYGGNFPVGDQWKYEFDHIYSKYAGGTLHFRDFFFTSGEHIEILPRLLDFSLLWISGTWNHVRELQVHTLLPALTCGVLVRCYIQLHFRPSLLSLGLITVLLSAPLTYFNSLSGTGAVFTCSILFTILAFWYASESRASLATTAISLAYSLAAFLSLGNGAFTTLMAAAAAGWTALYAEPRPRSRTWTAAAVLLFIATLLIVMGRHGSTDVGPNSLKSSARVLWDMLIWPDWPRKGVGLLLWIPFVFALAGVWRSRKSPSDKTGRSCRFASLLYGWVLLNFLAIAYSRSMYAGLVIHGRYYDVALMLVVAALFVPTPQRVARYLAALKLAAFVWILLFSISLKGQVLYLSMLYQRMAELQSEALALEAIVPGAGYQHFLKYLEIPDAMYFGTDTASRVRDLWVRVKDPRVQKLRPTRFPATFGNLFREISLRQCSRNMLDLSAPSSISNLNVSNAKVKMAGGALVLQAENNDPYVTFPPTDGPIREVSFHVSAPGNTVAEIYLVSPKGGVLGFEPNRRDVGPGDNVIRIGIAQEDIHQIRIDPGALPGQYIIREIVFSGECLPPDLPGGH